MQVLPAKIPEGNCTTRYSKGLKNQNWEHVRNLCEQNKLEAQVIFPYTAVSELARALFLVESTNSTKMHRAPTECWMHYFMITMYIDSLVTKILKQ